jgi:hypothetical protein
MKTKTSRPLAAGLAVLCFTVTGCFTFTGPRYNHHIGNTLELRAAGLDKVNVGEIRKDPAVRGDVDKVSTRASTVLSPYGSYTAYLREALSSEFDHADLLDASSGVRIDGVLIRNELAGSLDREYAALAAELTVTRGTEVTYRATKVARYEWQSTYPGEVAIPRAISNYQVGVQRLIAAFIADPEFVAALKKR